MYAISCKRPFTNNVSIFVKNWHPPLSFDNFPQYQKHRDLHLGQILTNPLLGWHHLWTVPKCTLQTNTVWLISFRQTWLFETNLVSDQMNDMAILQCFGFHFTSQLGDRNITITWLLKSLHLTLTHIKNHLTAFWMVSAKPRTTRRAVFSCVCTEK